MLSGLPQVKKFYEPADQVGQQKQSNITDIVTYLSKSPLIAAVFATFSDPKTKQVTKTIEFTQAGVDVPVNHGLGRVPNGWHVARRNVPCDVYENTSADQKTNDPTKYLVLRYQPSLFTPLTSPTVKVSIIVY